MFILKLINSILLTIQALFVLQNVKCGCTAGKDIIDSYNLSILKDRENFCKNIICEKIERCMGVIVANRSYHNCCPACVKYLGEGDPCSVPKKPEFRELILSECKVGLKCMNGKCTFDTSVKSCLLQKNIRENLRSEGNYAEDLWIPECDERGHFKAKQKKNKKSICVTQKGDKLFGEEDESGLEDMKCECSRHLHLMEHNEVFMTKPQEHCTPSGNFDTLQCVANLCYCSDQTTGAILSRMTTKAYLDKLACYNETYGKEYLRECEKEQQKSRLLRYELRQKGMNVPGLERVKCDPDGSFSPKQCDSKRCVCTDKLGVGIESHFTEVLEEFFKMTCSCARDLGRALSRSRFAAFKCKRYGDYFPYQCFDNGQCFCVDEDGDLVSKPLNKANFNESFCESFLHRLNEWQEKIFITTVADETVTSDDDNDNGGNDDYDYGF